MPETPSRISPERKWTEGKQPSSCSASEFQPFFLEKSESTTLVTNDQLLIDVAEEIVIVADLEVVRGIVADAADLTREIDEEDAARREAALNRKKKTLIL